MGKLATAERVSRDASDNFVFQRSLLAYDRAAEIVSGDVLEIGTGTGYGIELVAPHCDPSLIRVDFYRVRSPGVYVQSGEVESLHVINPYRLYPIIGPGVVLNVYFP